MDPLTGTELDIINDDPPIREVIAKRLPSRLRERVAHGRGGRPITFAFVPADLPDAFGHGMLGERTGERDGSPAEPVR